MYDDVSTRPWTGDIPHSEIVRQIEERESSERFYAAKDALERRDLSSEERRIYEGVMDQEFFRKCPEPPRDYLNEF